MHVRSNSANRQAEITMHMNGTCSHQSADLRGVISCFMKALNAW